MFGWFKRKQAAATQTASADASATADATADTSQVVEAAPTVEHAAPVAMPEPVAPPPAISVSPPGGAVVSPGSSEPISFNPQSARRMIGQVAAPRSLAPGAPAFELQRGRKREAEVLRTQANGRRVIARLTETGRIYAYTLRPDGTFRLEQAPTPVAAQLVRADN